MSLTDTARHWRWGCPLATAASRSDVNVAMPHLRGRWSPTKAILRTLEALFMKAFLYCLLRAALQRGSEGDPADSATRDNNRWRKAASLSTSEPLETRLPLR